MSEFEIIGIDAVPIGASRHLGSAAGGKRSWRLASKTKLALTANLEACTRRNLDAVGGLDVELTMLANEDAVRAVAVTELRSRPHCSQGAPAVRSWCDDIALSHR